MWFWTIVWLDIRKLLSAGCLLVFNMAWAQTGELRWRVGCWLGVVVILSQPWLGTPTIQIFKSFKWDIHFQMLGKVMLPDQNLSECFWILSVTSDPWTPPPRYFKQRHYQKWTCPNLRIIWFDYNMHCLLCCFGSASWGRRKKGKNKFWCVSRRFKAASFVSPIRLKETTKCPEWSIIIAHPKNSLVSPVPDKLFFNPLFFVSQCSHLEASSIKADILGRIGKSGCWQKGNDNSF